MGSKNEDCPPILDQLGQQANNSVEETILFKLYKQIRPLEINFLLSGLAVTAKDLLEYLVDKSYNDANINTFRLAWIAGVDPDRFYWEQLCPEVFTSLDDAKLPSGFTETIAKGEWAGICDTFNKPEIDREWARYIGWSFFKQYSTALKSAVNSATADPAWQQANDSDSRILFLANTLLGKTESKALHWALLLLFVSMLLVKTNFSTLANKERLEVPKRITI